MRLIELTGISGSGKSTITPILAKFLKSKGFEVYDKDNLILSCNEFPLNRTLSATFIRLMPVVVRNKILALFYRILDNKRTYLARYLLKNRKFFEAAINDISVSPLSFHQRTWNVLWWLNLISIYQMASDSQEENSILILEEGFYHKVINFYVHLNHDIDYSKIKIYLKSVPPIDILINVEASLDKCSERLQKRNFPRVIEGSTIEELHRYLVNSKKAIEYSEAIISSKGTKVIRILNTDSPMSRQYITDQLAKEFAEHDF